MIERKRRLDGTSVDFACELLRVQAGARAVLRYVTDREWVIGDTGLVVPPGTVTIAHYWMERPYNVYHWLTPTGATLALYCNVASCVEISEERVVYDDLAVDVIVRSSGAIDVLDEDEVPDDVAPRHRATIARALEAIAGEPRRLYAEIERETRAHMKGDVRA